MSTDSATFDTLALGLDTLLARRAGRCVLVAGTPGVEAPGAAALLARALARQPGQRVLLARLQPPAGDTTTTPAAAADPRQPGLWQLTLRGIAGFNPAAASGTGEIFDTVVIDALAELPDSLLDQACLSADGVLLAVTEGSGSLARMAAQCARWRGLQARLLGVILLAGPTRPPRRRWWW